MKTLLRIMIFLLVVLWLGAVAFFPAVAQVSFGALPPAQAGLVVRGALLTLHTEGLILGTLLLLLLLATGATRAYGRNVIGPVLCTVAMLLLTAFSQHNIVPRMEADRIAAGGDIDKALPTDPHRMDFNHLHAASVEVEEGVLVAGVIMVVLLGRPPLRERDRRQADYSAGHA